jgi:nucleoside 2-deoxyribosyltransferase
MRVYLAGPDVFLPDGAAWLERKKAICAGYGLTGVSPLDPVAGASPDRDSLPEWRRIANGNEAHIRSCAAILANLTPFRGPSADAGTIYEVGFARGLGLRIFAYATVTAPFLDRTLAAFPGARSTPDGGWWDADGMQIEQFGLFDNLMIEGGIVASGGSLIAEDRDRWRDLSVFERCVETAAGVLLKS